MIETLTTAVIVLALCLVGLALLFIVSVSDQNKRIGIIRKDTDAIEQAHRNNYSRYGNLEMRLDNAIDNLSIKVERHENTFQALTSMRRVARWHAFNKFNIMHEEESPRCEYCLSEDTEYDTKYIDIAGCAAPDRLVSQCCKCGQKSTIWRYENEHRP